MNPLLILSIVIIYFAILVGISQLVSKKDSSNAAFFSANKNSKWYLVAFGMIGTALSGVTFISVPGEVGASTGEQFKYFQFVLGNAAGFVVIATVLLPLYYRLNLVSIYEYFENRLGYYSYKSAAGIFLMSRTIGSAFRLYLVVLIFQHFVLDNFGVPFAATVAFSLALIYAYTYRAGLKTIIITDTLQTFFLVGSVILTIFFICDSLDLSIIEAAETVKQSSYSKIFFWEDLLGSRFHFLKQFIGGMFVTIASTGLDQDLMQKNLSCSNIKDAQKNMFTFTGIFVLTNLFFLCVGAMLYIYAEQKGVEIPTDALTGKARTDLLFPEIALNHLALSPGIVFLLGLIAATFATTDSALTALTTSFCVDFLEMNKPKNLHKEKNVRIRKWTHLTFCSLMFFVIIIFNTINDQSVVSMIFRLASYTYGPLLGLFAFSILFKNRTVRDQIVPYICLSAPLFTWLFTTYAPDILFGYIFDNELIIVNAGFTLIMLLLISRKQ